MAEKVLQRLRASLQQRGGGTLPLANVFKEFDTDGSGSLNWEEFCSALRKCGLTPSPQDVRMLFLACDKDGNNEISTSEFIDALRGPLSTKRQDMIARVFAGVDRDGDGIISMSDVGAAYNPKGHPLVVSGRMSVSDALSNMLDNFTALSNSGYITLAQFTDYYGNVAAFESNDAAFEKSLYALWNVGQPGSQTLKSVVKKLGGDSVNVEECLSRLREQLITHGARGIIGLGRKFRIMDDDGSKCLNMSEFRKGLKELGLMVSEQEIAALFAFFDKNRDGSVHYDEFLSGVRGVLNERRARLVRMAFDILDTDHSGVIEPEEIVARYDASKHPDVLSGKRSANQVLREFLDTFDVGGEKDGKVTAKEFENYYANVSASIDNDDYFELMMRNAWHISGGEGWSANSANRRVLVTGADGNQSVVEIKNDLGLAADDKQGMMNRLKAQGVDVANLSLYDGADNRTGAQGPRPSSGSLSNFRNTHQQASFSGVSSAAIAIATNGPSAIDAGCQKRVVAAATGNAGINFLITKMKTQLKAHGAHGFIGLQRKFRIMDDDGDRRLSLSEWKKALKELKMNLSDSELRSLFNYFDSDGSNSIDFEEFVQGVRDPLNERRLTLVHAAFTRIDLDGSGDVDVAEIARIYDSSKHPEVIAGRKTADQVFREFLDTFDVGGEKDGKVTAKEFENYYANIGANIDNDDYFELMMRNAWHISGGEGWSANSANRRVLVTGADGNQSVVEIKNDLGLAADDKQGMMNRLKAQGVNGSISLSDSIDNTGGPKKARSLRNLASGTSPDNACSSYADTESTPEPISKDALIAAKGARAAAPLSSPHKKHAEDVRHMASPGLQLLISKLKNQLKARGAFGFIGLQRKFRIMDDDGSRSLDMAEFKKAMKECALNLSESECRLLFKHFDSNQNGSIDFEEFIQGVRDPLSERRASLVNMAFDRLDKEHKGAVAPQDLIGTFDASKHPDVVSGNKTAQSVLQEFLDTFDVGGEKDGKVTRQEFINYYTNIGASIDNDDYFELMIRNAWHISGGEGWSANSANRRVLVTGADGNQSVVEIKNDLGLAADDKQGMMNRLKAQGTNATSVFTFGSADNREPATGRRRYNVHMGDSSISSGVLPGTSNTSYKTKSDVPAPKRSKSPPRVAPVGVQNIVSRLKIELANRGARGFVGLQRKFRIMDDDGNHQLDRSEFSKAMREMNLGLADADCRLLFDHFDKDSSSTISFEEFIQGVRNPLNEHRLRLIDLAFQKIDLDGNGYADAAEIAQLYDASKHPEVLAGRMTPDQVYHEFLDTFDVGGEKDGKVTRQEFENYYANIGASIDNDDYFELMIRNAWHISGGEGWSANSANRRVLVTGADGNQSVVEIKNDLGLAADDKQGMMNRLKAQGVDVANLSLYDGADNRTEGKVAGRASTAPVASRQMKTNAFASSMDGIFGASKQATPSRPSTASSISTRSTLPPTPMSARFAKADHGVLLLMQKLKNELRSRGGNGFVGLQRKFRIMDDDGDKSLSLGEFKKAMQECNMGLRDQEVRMLFDFFDTDGNRKLDFEEFIQGVRDPLTERRLNLVTLAFNRLDEDGNGLLDAQELIAKYDASKHPDVVAGKQTAHQVLEAWMNTFEVGGVVDGKVTFEEFINYYTNIGASIDNDDYFELMIRNAWHISGGEGWSANSANRRVLVTGADGNQSVVEIKNDLGLAADDKQGMMNRLKAQGTHATSINLSSSVDHTEAPLRSAKKLVAGHGSHHNIWQSVGSAGNPNVPRSAKKPLANANRSSIFIGDDSTPANLRPDVVSRSAVQPILSQLKAQLANHGARGFVGLQRKFKIIDDDNSKTIDASEFRKAMKECGLDLNDQNLMLLFQYFDCDGNGHIDFEEFIQGLRGDLNAGRKRLISMAFNIIDKDGNGLLEPEDLMSVYDSSRHPDVLAGKRTPGEVLQEFLDTFDVGGEKDGKVTRQEFENYYHNISASIDNDDYFELMMRNAWHISGGEGWSANSANRRVLVTGADGNQSVVEIKNDLGLAADDKQGMMNRLKAQGTNATSVATTFGNDTRAKPKHATSRFNGVATRSQIVLG